MKYLLLLLGVAQARERRLSGTGSITWDIIENGVKTGNETRPCSTDGVIHAAMCGKRLLADSVSCSANGDVPELNDGDEETLPCPVNQVGTRTATCSGGTTTVQSTCRPVGDFTDASKKQAAREALKSGMPAGGKKLREASYATLADRKDKLIQAKTARRDYLKAQITVDTWKDLVIEDDNEFEGYTEKVLDKRQARIDAGKSGKIRYRVAPTGLGCQFDSPDLTLTKEAGMDTVDPEGCVTIRVQDEPGVIKMRKNGTKFDLECNGGSSSPGLDVGDEFTCKGRVWDIGTATTDANDFVGETIWVDVGDLSAPYYNFYTDAGCTAASTGELTPDTQYMFKRCGDAVDHPFAVNSTSGWQPSEAFDEGLKGNESVIVTTDISGTVGWKCTNHPIMAGGFCVGAYDVCGRCGGDGTPTAGHWCADGVETEHGCGLGQGVKEGYYDGTRLRTEDLPTDSADICEVCAPSDQEYSNETDTSMCIQHTKCGEDLQPNANPFGANADHICEACPDGKSKPLTNGEPNYEYCQKKGCTDPVACNHDPDAIHNDNSCDIPDDALCETCNGTTAQVTLDADGDGVCNDADAFPSDSSESLDTDNDGLGDNADTVSGCRTPTACNYDSSSTVNHNASLCDIPNDALCETCNGTTAQVTLDADGDGVCNDADGCPNDEDKTAIGVCGCGVSDADTDEDGTADCLDACPNDKYKTTAGVCGCGNPDTDTDNNGTPDCNDPDNDGDGILDVNEAADNTDPLDAASYDRCRKATQDGDSAQFINNQCCQCPSF